MAFLNVMEKIQLYISILLAVLSATCFIIVLSEPMTSEAFLIKIIALFGMLYSGALSYKILPKKYRNKLFQDLD